MVYARHINKMYVFNVIHIIKDSNVYFLEHDMMYFIIKTKHNGWINLFMLFEL